MIVWHFFRVFLHLMAGLLTCGLVFPFSSYARREYLIRRWSKKLLAICTVDVAFKDHSGGAVAEHAMVISNHISWLDIFVINTLHPCHFVAKSDIRSWPLLGWLCEKAGTIFLARGKQREVRRIYEGLVHQIQDGKRVAFFPEGTTAAQGNVLSFHANLFEAAIEAKVPVQTFVLRYVDAQGKFHPAADFIGDMTFVESMGAILRAPRMTAELIRLPAIPTEGAHRREVAQVARAAVMRELGVADPA
ncbi:1-acyl-sn-glycerol-3-phosphate acyltransferase [Undibacterium sp. TS12]|nr:lysophospholipid acyltransferase family protein [Undibacterium sp. TS12]MCH8620134.1 1-acyl-sn-glycerol-3-phosphate acyltransferase [Undibacterium sp. TS12]